MSKVGILDDEVIICETLTKYLRELGYDVLDYALNYEESIGLINEGKPDIMLLDINIGGVKTGLDVAKHVRENCHIPLIFISSYSDKNTVSSVMSVQPNGYLVKPFTKEDLYTAIESALSNYSSIVQSNNSIPATAGFKLLNDAFFIKQDSFYVKVNFQDVHFIKSDSVYAEIYTKEKKYLIRESLKNLLAIFPGDDFFQVHRSYIINVNHIKAVNTEYVMFDKENIPISKTYKDEFFSRLNIK